MDTNLDSPRQHCSPETVEEPASGSVVRALYASPADASAAVHRDFIYWTEKLTDTSFQLSFAIIAANWATFNNVSTILTNTFAKLSMFFVLTSLALSVLGAFVMGELHRSRVDYCEDDAVRWGREFRGKLNQRDPWPFTHRIEYAGKVLRVTKTFLPLLAGILYVVSLWN